jgi:hypothetical protein
MKKAVKKLKLVKTQISYLTQQKQKNIIGGGNQSTTWNNPPTVKNPFTRYSSACC